MKFQLKHLWLVVPVVSTLAVLSGCSKKEEGAGNPVAQAALMATMHPNRDYNQVTLKRKPLADLNSYTVMDARRSSLFSDSETKNQHELMKDIYWSTAEKNLDQLAIDFSEQYRAEIDTFKRKDLLLSIKSQLDAEYDKRHGKNQFAFLGNRVLRVFAYDAQMKGFPINLWVNSTGFSWTRSLRQSSSSGGWSVEYLGDTSIDGRIAYQPANETEARTIESELASLRGKETNIDLPVVLYGHVEKTSANDSFYFKSLFVVDGVAALNPKTQKPLFVADKKTLGDQLVVAGDLRREFYKVD